MKRQSARPSIPTPAWVRRTVAQRYNLSPVTRAVLLCLWDHVERNGTSNWSQPQIAAEVGCTDRGVRDALLILIGLDLITVVDKPVGYPVVYSLTVTPPPRK
ncbi:helix-turn-helix domain-containing protein [Microbacterium sp. B2969]|uniref:Helix-turn-helix domain-containing protein n=1 Tax=Microbacterium alkaliflavum TaxID=3248839 RepID=A0ABW7QEY9_9MICO